MSNNFWLAALLCGLFFVICNCAPSTETPKATTPGPTPEPPRPCKDLTGCEECVKNITCIFCFTNNKCSDYPKKDIIPRSDDCDLGQTRWATCALNYKALLISMGVIAGVLLLSCSGCILYCCCCRGPSGRQRRRWAKEDAKEERKKAERQMKQDQRKAERQAKNDEIRRKYGLLQNESDDEDERPLTQVTEEL